MQDHTIASRDQHNPDTWKLFLKIFIKTTLLSFVFVFIFLLITLGVVGAVALSKINRFESLTQTKKEALFELFKEGWSLKLPEANDRYTVLVLGVDTLANRGDVQALTDTMLLASVHFDTGEIHLLPIPRDLWSEAYKTKVNALYSYGEERYPGTPEQFTYEVIQEMTNLPIQETIVISLDTLAELIDTVGGITVDVPVAFKDEMFPRTDVDVTVERDPAKLYKTIEFVAGEQIMSGQTALEYIRSRHSTDAEGSDTARSNRQQLVIQSLIKKVTQAETLKSTETVAKLYTLYSNSFARYISIPTIIALGRQLYPVKDVMSFHNEGLTVYPDSTNGSIFHPPERQYDNQWVYAIRDQSVFQKEIQIKLLQNEANQVEYIQE